MNDHPPTLEAHHYRQLALYLPKHFALTLLGWILFSLAPLVIGWLNQQIFDRLSGGAAVGLNVWTLLALLLVAQVMQEGIAIGWLYRQLTWEWVMQALLRSNLFANVLQRLGRCGIAEADSITPGDAISRFRDDIGTSADLVNEWYRLIGHGLFALVALTIMWQINPWVTLAATLPLSGVVIVVHRLRTRLAITWQRAREDASRVTSFISALFGAVLAVKVAGAELPVTQRFRQLNEERRHSALRHTLIDSVINWFNLNIINLGRGLVLLTASQAFHAGSFTVGDLALFLIYLEEFLELPRRIGRLLAQRKTSTVSTARLLELMPEVAPGQLVMHREIHLDEAPDRADSTDIGRAARLEQLEVKGLTFRYPENGRGIEGVDLHVQRGTITVITGRVGAGKTTLLRVLLGLLPRQSGEIRWNSVVVADPAGFFIPPQVAYTPQMPRLFSETLRHNVLLGLPEAQVDLAGALRAAVIELDLAQMTQGVDTLIGARGMRLSGGQIQRTAAARMFVRQPALLVVDDLSSALDVETEQQLWERLFNRPDRPACLVISHRRAALQRADQIVVLKDGRVEDRGRLEELLVRSEEMQRLWAGENVTTN